MKMNDFLATCLRMDGAVVDRICDDYDLDIEERKVYEILEQCSYDQDYKNFGRALLVELYSEVIEKYSYALDPLKFSFDFGSPSYPVLYYDGKAVNSKNELDLLARNGDEEETGEETD